MRLIASARVAGKCEDAPGAPPLDDVAYLEDEQASRIAADLEAVFDVPVQVSAVLGRSKMDVGELLKLGPGTDRDFAYWAGLGLGEVRAGLEAISAELEEVRVEEETEG